MNTDTQEYRRSCTISGTVYPGMDQLLWEVQVMGDEPVLSVAEKTACNVGKTVRALQNEHQPGLCLAEKSERTISDTIFPLEGRIHVMKRIDLYNKSRMMEDYQARFVRAGGEVLSAYSTTNRWQQ